MYQELLQNSTYIFSCLGNIHILLSLKMNKGYLNMLVNNNFYFYSCPQHIPLDFSHITTLQKELLSVPALCQHPNSHPNSKLSSIQALRKIQNQIPSSYYPRTLSKSCEQKTRIISISCTQILISIHFSTKFGCMVLNH